MQERNEQDGMEEVTLGQNDEEILQRNKSMEKRYKKRQRKKEID